MKLALLAARVGARRQCLEQRMVEAAAGELLRQLLEIDAGKISLDARVDHVARERIGRPLPERKHRRKASAVELLLAIAAHVLKKEIAEDHTRDAVGLRVSERCRHARLIHFVRAREWDRHTHRRQADRFELGSENALAHAMHADATEGLGDGGERAHNLAVAGATHFVQRPGTVLAARPGDQRLRPSAHRRPPNSRNIASAARSPDSQAPPTVPHSVSCAASPAKYRRLSGSIRMRRADCPPGDAAENAPSTLGSSFQRVAWRRCTRDLRSVPNRFPSHSSANATISFSPLAERSRPKLPATSIMHSVVPDELENSEAVRGLFDFSRMSSSLRSPSGLPGNSSATWS